MTFPGHDAGVLAIVSSATLLGLDGRAIRVEVDVAPGLPGFTIVGLPDTALQEARERIRGAIRNAGFVHPPRRITVNLAPADLRKAGSSLDLAMAIGILLGSEQVRPGTQGIGLIGELSLGGEVRSVPGILPMAAALARRGIRRLVVASDGAAEARLVTGLDVEAVESLGEAALCVSGPRRRSVRVRPLRVGLGTSDGEVEVRTTRPSGGAARTGPRRGPWPGGGAPRSRDRPRRGTRPALHRAARFGQDPARADRAESPAGAGR